MDVFSSVEIGITLIQLLVGVLGGIPALLALFYGAYIVLTDKPRERREAIWKGAGQELGLTFREADDGFRLEGEHQGIPVEVRQRRSWKTLIGRAGEMDVRVTHASPETQAFHVFAQPNHTNRIPTGDVVFDDMVSVLAPSDRALQTLSDRDVRESILRVAPLGDLTFSNRDICGQHLREPQDPQGLVDVVRRYTTLVEELHQANRVELHSDAEHEQETPETAPVYGVLR